MKEQMESKMVLVGKDFETEIDSISLVDNQFGRVERVLQNGVLLVRFNCEAETDQ